MGSVIGGGTGRFLTDETGDPIDSTNRLDVNAALSSSDRGIGSAVVSYTQFDAVDGTAVNLEDATNGINVEVEYCLEIILQADYDNTGYVMVGGSGVAADTKGIRLNAGDMLSLSISHTANVYIDGSASSQKVNVSIRRDS